MANLRPPEYGVKKDELTLTSQDPASVLYGVTPDNKFIPIKITDTGELVLGSNIVLEMSDLQIGAVELKNYNTDDRVYVSPDHEVLTQARLYDAAGTGLTSTTFGPSQALDINVVGGTTISASTDEDDSVPAGMQLATVINLAYGYDGVDWQRINSTSGRLHVDGSGVTQPISAVALPLPTGAATEATLSLVSTEATLNGFRTDFNAVDFATETTLAGIKSQTDQLSFTGANLNVNIAGGVTLEVNLDNANDDVLVYGFDGAVNRAIKTNASGELEVHILSSALPTGAATELTLSGFRTDFNAIDFATQTTLLAVETALNQFTFLGGSVNSNITNATLAVTQSGAWSTGRTWTLASGTDSVSSVQSGIWNINDISGIISLPTGAATEATLATRLADATFTGRINTLGQKTMANSTPVVLASDQTAIPASQSGNWSVRVQDGTGNNITSAAIGATRALDIEQVSTASQTAAANNQVFVTSFDFNLPSGGVETPALLLKNPLGSGKTFIIKTVLVSGISTANNEAVISIYANPTILVNGVAQTANTTSIGSGAVSVATPFGATTTAANGTRFLAWQVPSAANNTPAAPPVNVDGMIRLEPNNNLLITGKPAANNMNIAWTVVWQEV